MEEGDISTSLFILDDGWYTPDLIEQMWYYFMSRDSHFGRTFLLTSKMKEEIENGLNEEYLTQENVKLYEEHFKPCFRKLLTFIRDKISTALVMCSSNIPSKNNACIVYTGGAFKYIQVPNSRESCDHMNSALLDNQKNGNHCHIVLISC